ncbi:hypothetical protein G6F56_013450 [Rhizopus delemar]|nr:hypothetical protein G6F56_013450 [Rhizopus delemar]
MADMTRKMGPLKHYSCRSTERTIKSFTSNVRSTTRPGVNSSNILFDRANSNQYGIQEIINGMGEPSSTTDATTFLELPNNEGTFPQLWDPNQNQTVFGDGEVMAGLSDGVLLSAIRSYYHRLYHQGCFSSLTRSFIQAGEQFFLFAIF